MANLTITAADVAPVEIIEQKTLPAAATFEAGAYVRPDSNGEWVTGSAVAGGADIGNLPGIALRDAKFVNQAVTVIRKGTLDLGDALDGLAVDAAVYLSDTEGTLADTTGTVSTIVGYVDVIHGETGGPHKVLRLDL